jgi:hypothetical protein
MKNTNVKQFISKRNTNAIPVSSGKASSYNNRQHFDPTAGICNIYIVIRKEPAV